MEIEIQTYDKNVTGTHEFIAKKRMMDVENSLHDTLKPRTSNFLKREIRNR